MKSIIKILIILIVLAGVALLVQLVLVGENPKAPEVAQKPVQEPEAPREAYLGILLTKTQNQNQAPFGFPDIPLNGKIKVNNSYSLNYQNSGSEQKVIDFTSSKPVKENFMFYKDWAEKNGWNVLYELDNPEESRIVIEKNKKSLSIVIQKDAERQSKINMSL